MPVKRKGISVSAAKAKGRRLQQLVRDTILEAYPDLEQDDVKSTGMGQNGSDVQLSPAARKLFGYSVECKARKTFADYNYYDQAAQGPFEPLVVIRGDRRKPLVIISLDHFMELQKK